MPFHPLATFGSAKRSVPYVPLPPIVTGNGVVWGAATTPLPSAGAKESNAQAFTNHEANVGTIGIYRTYSVGQWPATWAAMTDGALYGTWQTRWSWCSFKPDVTLMGNGSLNTSLAAFIDSIPVTKYPRLFTYFHEPGDNFTTTAARISWKRAAFQFGKTIQAAKRPDILVGPIFTSGSTVANDTLLMDSDPTIDINSVSDFCGYDPYHERSRKGFADCWTTPYLGAAGLTKYMTPCLNFRDKYFPGKPFAIGEHGACNDEKTPVGQRRSDWLAAMENWSQTAANNVLAVCYYDATAGAGTMPNWVRINSLDHTPVASSPIPGEALLNMNKTYPDDPTSRAALGAIYARNPAYPLP